MFNSHIASTELYSRSMRRRLLLEQFAGESAVGGETLDDLEAIKAFGKQDQDSEAGIRPVKPRRRRA